VRKPVAVLVILVPVLSGGGFRAAKTKRRVQRRKNLPSCRASHYHFAMPSFDIVSEVNSMEIENAVNIAKKELANRFDFKGSKAEIVLEKNDIKLSAEDQFKITALVEIVMGKLAKRSISMKNVEQGTPDVSPLGHARQVIKIKQGIATDIAKQVTTFIRDSKFKVTTQIQDQQIRVTGKSRDELQEVMAAVRGKDFPVAVQFQNFRD
jgi:uncharacterized protein YajQ (UPF0234 family)